jgi:exodeoxyribonuclease-5
MLKGFFLEYTKKNFPFELTHEQYEVLEKWSEFLFDRDADSLFLLKGYAGTGKSSLIGAVVKTLNELKQKSVLLAPTGRAAKVFSAYSGQNAYTIHKKIYRQKEFSNDPTGFVLADNLNKNTLFIVDEASMISNDGLDSSFFGSGRLLDDLIHYVYSGEGCRLVLLGDSAQLPPVSQPESPALNISVLQTYGLNVKSMTLTEVVRQEKTSGILTNATLLRKRMSAGNISEFPKLRTQSNTDVQVVAGEDLLETIQSAYHRDGVEETIIITRSNKRANGFNNTIRNRILFREEELTTGDLLMIVKNNYYWAKEEESMEFIANGDLLEILRIRRIQELYGFRFCDVKARFPDYDTEIELKILLETLHTDSPALPKELNDKLFYAILEDYADISLKREKMKLMKVNPFYNVVQVKYAYAVTCHKAQGGQWKNVFIDLSYIPQEHIGIEFYRWLYTAFTRATERVYLINPNKLPVTC